MKKKIKDTIFWLISAPFIIVISGLLIMALLQLIAFTYFILTMPITKGESVYEYTHQFEIQSLKDNQAHIVSRYSSNSQQRYYFIRNMDGGLKSGWVKANDSVIIENDSERPRIEVYKGYPKYGKWIFKIAFDNGIIDMTNDRQYRIYIPKGSVTEEFTIDNE